MADQLRLRGGPTAESEVFVGAEREITVDTELKALRIHDGVTPGGHLVELKADALSARSTAATLDLQARQQLQTSIDNAISTFNADDVTTLANAKTYSDGILTTANSYTDTAINNLIGGSPDLLNTLNEIAEAINDDENFFSTLTTSISALQADVNSNEATALAGRNTLSGRLDVLETDPTTGAALAAQLTTVQGLISAVQTDVNLNEADADAAISAEEAARIAADSTLTSSFTSEASTRAAADITLQTNITAEETSRISAVNTLTATINTNEAAHVVSHNVLQSSLDTINTDRNDLEERLLQAGLATGILYVSNFTGG